MTTEVLGTNPIARMARWLPPAIFVLVFVFHALYIRQISSAPPPGWANVGIVDNTWLGFGAYVEAGDYFTGFSYALASAFGVWAIMQFFHQRRAAMAAGAVGSVSLMGILMVGGCFLIGCCGSPMLAVYLSIFGAKALGVGKPLMALVTLLSTGCGYYWLSRRFGNRTQYPSAPACCSGPTCCSRAANSSGEDSTTC